LLIFFNNQDEKDFSNPFILSLAILFGLNTHVILFSCAHVILIAA